jgi:hypothetical protein
MVLKASSLLKPMAVNTWDGSTNKEVQAEPLETATFPNRPIKTLAST